MQVVVFWKVLCSIPSCLLDSAYIKCCPTNFITVWGVIITLYTGRKMYRSHPCRPQTQIGLAASVLNTCLTHACALSCQAASFSLPWKRTNNMQNWNHDLKNVLFVWVYVFKQNHIKSKERRCWVNIWWYMYVYNIGAVWGVLRRRQIESGCTQGTFQIGKFYLYSMRHIPIGFIYLMISSSALSIRYNSHECWVCVYRQTHKLTCSQYQYIHTRRSPYFCS